VDAYQLIATASLVGGSVVTAIKAWTTLNERQNQQSKMLVEHAATMERMQNSFEAYKAENNSERARLGSALIRIETLLDERTEKKI